MESRYLAHTDLKLPIFLCARITGPTHDNCPRTAFLRVEKKPIIAMEKNGPSLCISKDTSFSDKSNTCVHK
ncbi:hypothetical protein LEMLEM_LOCUS24270 [Lemmus lemmus]